MAAPFHSCLLPVPVSSHLQPSDNCVRLCHPRKQFDDGNQEENSASVDQLSRSASENDDTCHRIPDAGTCRTCRRSLIDAQAVAATAAAVDMEDDAMLKVAHGEFRKPGYTG